MDSEIVNVPSATGRFSLVANRTVQQMYRSIDDLIKWENIYAVDVIQKAIVLVDKLIEKGVETCSTDIEAQPFTFSDARDILYSVLLLCYEQKNALTKERVLPPDEWYGNEK